MTGRLDEVMKYPKHDILNATEEILERLEKLKCLKE